MIKIQRFDGVDYEKANKFAEEHTLVVQGGIHLTGDSIFILYWDGEKPTKNQILSGLIEDRDGKIIQRARFEPKRIKAEIDIKEIAFKRAEIREKNLSSKDRANLNSLYDSQINSALSIKKQCDEWDSEIKSIEETIAELTK
jgi:hypothetical protein